MFREVQGQITHLSSIKAGRAEYGVPKVVRREKGKEEGKKRGIRIESGQRKMGQRVQLVRTHINCLFTKGLFGAIMP